MILTKVTGALIGIGGALGVYAWLTAPPHAPVYVTCTDAMLVPQPETDATEIFLTCKTNADAPVRIQVPAIPGQ